MNDGNYELIIRFYYYICPSPRMHISFPIVKICLDFDMTLTRYWVNGKRNISAHAVITKSPRLPQSFIQKSSDLFDHYYPIEISRELTVAEKIPHMIDWWNAAHQQIVDSRLTMSDISGMVQDANIVFRDGVDLILRDCHNRNIPFLIFSAGLAGKFF